MKVFVDLWVVPIGVGVPLAPSIAACERELTTAALKIQLHPNGTAIEGEKQQTLEGKVARVQALL
ncbi:MULTISPECIES: thiamine-binding protein [Aphanothece]|uniref:thiamine-binding protein n=1 Tax=Aphanothece TaxID=1121 RepID=UPI0039851138